jgi:hypothetical protein
VGKAQPTIKKFGNVGDFPSSILRGFLGGGTVKKVKDYKLFGDN